MKFIFEKIVEHYNLKLKSLRKTSSSQTLILFTQSTFYNNFKKTEAIIIDATDTVAKPPTNIFGIILSIR